MKDELLDLVNPYDKIIDTKPRSKVYELNLNNFRAINVFLVNSQGQLWIPRRTAHKKNFPLCLDMSVAGHVESGEDYDDAFKREVREELNLDVDQTGYKTLGKLTPHEHGTSAFVKVYEINTDHTPNYNPDDFFEYSWLYPQELLEKLKMGEKAKSDLGAVVRIFYIKSAA